MRREIDSIPAKSVGKNFMTDQAHWADLEETTKSNWKFRFMLWTALHLPQKFVEFLAAVIVFFFYLGATPIRERSKQYLAKVFAARGERLPRFSVYLHFLAYTLSMIEKIRSWAGKMFISEIRTFDDDLENLTARLNEGKGALILCSHLGNMEVMRALTDFQRNHAQKKFKVFPVINFSVTKKFNALLEGLNPDWKHDSFDADQIGVETAIAMRTKLEEGNLIAIAADRISNHVRDRTIPLNFLGETAEFPEGAFVLAKILKVPVYFIFALREKDLDISSPYEFHVIQSCTKSRKNFLEEIAHEYAALLERYAKEHPYQWYNFYNFWQKENP